MIADTTSSHIRMVLTRYIRSLLVYTRMPGTTLELVVGLQITYDSYEQSSTPRTAILRTASNGSKAEELKKGLLLLTAHMREFLVQPSGGATCAECAANPNPAHVLAEVVQRGEGYDCTYTLVGVGAYS